MENMIISPYVAPLLDYNGGIDNNKCGRLFTCEYVVNKAVQLWDVDYNELIGKSRKRELVDIRAAICINLRIDTDIANGLNEISKVLKRNHATIIHYCKVHINFKNIAKMRKELLENMSYIRIHKTDDGCIFIMRSGKYIKMDELTEVQRENVIKRLEYMKQHYISEAVISA